MVDSDHALKLQAQLALIKWYRADGDQKAARRLIEQEVEQNPDDARWIQMLADQAILEDDLVEASKHAERLVELAPTPTSIIYLADLYIRHDRPEKTLNLLKEHVGLMNRSPYLQSLRGRALGAAGNRPQARQVFILALERSNTYTLVDAVTNQLTTTMGPDDALALVSEVLNHSAPVMLELQKAKLNLNLNRHEAALAILNSIETRLPSDNARVVNDYERMRASSLHGTGDHAAALAIYEKLLAEQPNDVSTLNNLAYLLANDMDQADTALKYAERAAQLHDGSAHVLDTLGWVLFKVGRTADARDTLQRSVDLEELAPNCFHLGAVYDYLGISDRAKELYGRAVELAETAGDTKIAQEARDGLAKLD